MGRLSSTPGFLPSPACSPRLPCLCEHQLHTAQAKSLRGSSSAGILTPHTQAQQIQSSLASKPCQHLAAPHHLRGYRPCLPLCPPLPSCRPGTVAGMASLGSTPLPTRSGSSSPQNTAESLAMVRRAPRCPACAPALPISLTLSPPLALSGHPGPLLINLQAPRAPMSTACPSLHPDINTRPPVSLGPLLKHNCTRDAPPPHLPRPPLSPCFSFPRGTDHRGGYTSSPPLAWKLRGGEVSALFTVLRKVPRRVPDTDNREALGG